MEEYLTLILNKNRINVNREKLASKSCYFASLFSHNFSDSHNKEHTINYDIALHTLQNFVQWVHHEDCVYIDCHSIKVSMTKFMQDNFIELLNLLQLSILFVVDELTNDIIDIIVLCWLLPEKVIDIWLLAQELSIKILQDICLSVCLDQFDNLPQSLLFELPAENIIQLIGNDNLSDIVDIKERRQPKFIQGTVIYETDEKGIMAAYLYTWDGNALCKCVQLHSIQYPGEWLTGMQVVARGFSVYTVGGELRLENGHFNEIISRYCLLSKKWYYQARLKVPRRHMITVFIGNKLLVVGGVGIYRLKFGMWTRGAGAPENFSEVPPHVVVNECLIFLKSSIHIYWLKYDCWITQRLHCRLSKQIIATLTSDTTFLITDEMILTRIDIAKEDFDCEEGECLKEDVDRIVMARIKPIRIGHSVWYTIRFLLVSGIGVMMLTPVYDEYKYVHAHTIIRKDYTRTVIPKSYCFKIMDPCSLYSTV
ncbi:hypothetical protein WN48_09830 [Eufriesea mexicana]|uniref:BTB domain-containing protein n=1 Tax=Eufriesea mexicana TaxID=516756 RepID=A0A310SIW5_9HYME|nr:hypothetical protein WN48_09830 [Eufriesea mexicana]